MRLEDFFSQYCGLTRDAWKPYRMRFRAIDNNIEVAPRKLLEAMSKAERLSPQTRKQLELEAQLDPMREQLPEVVSATRDPERGWINVSLKNGGETSNYFVADQARTISSNGTHVVDLNTLCGEEKAGKFIAAINSKLVAA